MSGGLVEEFRRGDSLPLFFVVLVVAAVLTTTAKRTKLNRLLDPCLVRVTPFAAVSTAVRGRNYYLDGTGKQTVLDKDCLMTGWGASHVFLYFVLGFLVPRRFFLAMFVSAAFEVGEWALKDCHDLMDLLWNALGYAAGVGVRYTVSAPRPRARN